MNSQQTLIIAPHIRIFLKIRQQTIKNFLFILSIPFHNFQFPYQILRKILHKPSTKQSQSLCILIFLSAIQIHQNSIKRGKAEPRVIDFWQKRLVLD